MDVQPSGPRVRLRTSELAETRQVRSRIKLQLCCVKTIRLPRASKISGVGGVARCGRGQLARAVRDAQGAAPGDRQPHGGCPPGGGDLGTASRSGGWAGQ